MLTQELALAHALVGAMIQGDVYEQPDLSQALYQIVGEIDDDEGDVMGRSFARATRLIETDLPRWRAAGDVAAQWDLHEVLDAVLAGFRNLPDPHQAATLVALSNSLGVDAKRRATVRSAVLERTLPTALGRLLRVRLGELDPDGELETSAFMQMWPAGKSAEQLRSVSPVVYVAERDAPPELLWRTIAVVARSGARVRRIPRWSPDSVSIPRTLSHVYPLVAWTGSAADDWAHWAETRGRRPQTILAPTTLSSLEVGRFLRKVDDGLASVGRLPRRASEVDVASETFSVATLSAGAFDSAEMEYLGAAGRSTLQRLSKDVLRPLDADVHRWRFSQLVTLRLFQAFKARGMKFRGQADLIVHRIEEIAEASARHRVALDAAGDVFVDDGGGFRSLRGDQQALEPILIVDEAFRSFELGGGTVPDLLRPGLRTVVDPAVLGGTPSVQGQRLSARAITILALRGDDVVRSAYPELGTRELRDAVNVGREIIKRQASAR